MFVFSFFSNHLLYRIIRYSNNEFSYNEGLIGPDANFIILRCDCIVKEGYFIYPEYGVAIKMTSNSIWCWQTHAVHDTAKLNLSEGGVRYTSAITLTEKTAKAIEKEAKIIEN